MKRINVTVGSLLEVKPSEELERAVAKELKILDTEKTTARLKELLEDENNNRTSS